MPVHKEIEKPVLEVVPTIEQTGKQAVDNATAGIDQLKSDAQLKQFNLAAMEYQKNENKIVADLGRAAEGLIKKGNFDDASLALGMAELLTQTGELKTKYTEAWKSDFESYAGGLADQTKKGLTDENRKEAYLTMNIVLQNISNAARMEKIEYLLERAQSPKWKESTKEFVIDAVDGAQKLYSEGKMEDGDKVLAYLTFYTETILKKGIKGKEGRGAIENAIKVSLAGDWEKADKLFQKSIKDYGVTMAAKQLWGEYAKLESGYNMTSDVYGKDIGLEVKLKNIKKALDGREVNKAFDLLSGFSKDLDKYVEKNILVNLGDIQKDLKTTPKVMEEYQKGLKPYAQEFPDQVKKIVGKLEKVSNDSVTLLDKAETLEKDYKAGKGDEKKTKKFYSDMGEFNSDLEDFAKERKDAIGTASTGVLLMGNIMSEKQFKQILKMSNVEYVRKEQAMTQGDIAVKNMEESLNLIIDEGPDSKKAKKAYESAVYAKTGALAILDLEKLPYEEEEAKFAFFSNGAMKVYDKCAKGEATAEVWKLNDTLFNMESAVLASDDKLFATKEAELQKGIIDQSKILAGHYTAKIDGEKALVLSTDKAATYAYNIGKDAEKLGKKIENAEKINMAVKLAASFVHPSLFIATTVEMAVKEYEVTDKITWSTGLMLAASALAFRHAAIFKGVSLLKGGTAAAKVAKVTLTGVELGIGGVLMAHGGVQTYHAFKAGQYAEGATTLSMFALPLLYAVARKPMMTYMGKKVPAFRQFSGEFVTEAAVSKQSKKFGMVDAVALGKKGWQAGKEYALKAWEEVKAVPEMIKVTVKGAPVPVFIPGPLMFLVGLSEKAAAKVKKPAVVLDVLKKATTGDKEKYAKGMEKYGVSKKEGTVGGNFYDTITAESNVAEMEGSLKDMRSDVTGIVSKEKSDMYKVLNNEFAEGAQNALKEIFGPNFVQGMESVAEVGLVMLDKSKTWMLNNIHKAFGDLGLFIYFKAAKNLEAKFGIKAIRTSAQGDEMLLVFTGENIPKMKEYGKALKNEVKTIAKEMGFKEGEALTEAVSDFGAVDVEAIAQISKEGKISFITEGVEKPFENLDSMLSMSEAKQMLNAMTKEGKDVSILLPFLELPEASIPKVDIVKVDKLPETTILDEVVSIRIDFEKGTKNTLWSMTNHVGKGVSQVDNGIIGPSVLNQLGHPVTDAFSAIYQDAIIKAVKKHKLPVTVYDHGPMSVALKFEKALTKAEMETLDIAISEANEALLENPVLMEKGIEINGVESFKGKTKDVTSHMVAEAVMGHNITEGNYATMKQLVTVLHTEPAKIIEVLADKGLDAKTLGVLESIKKKNVKWVRNPEDLVHYLKNNNVDKKTIMTVFDQLEVGFGEVYLNKNYTGIPEEYSYLVTGKPKVNLIQYIDIENGSSAGVFLGEMKVKGETKEVAVKIYKNAWKDDWKHAAGYFEKEIENGKKLAELGLGPEVYGAVDVEGNMAYAMEVVRGYDSESLSYLKPSELAELIKPDKPGEPGTVTQLQQKYDKLIHEGYYIGDFQYSVLTEDQVLAGKPMKKGDVIFWDAGSMVKLKPGEVDAPYIMKGADRAKELSKIIGFLPEAVAEVKKKAVSEAPGVKPAEKPAVVKKPVAPEMPKKKPPLPKAEKKLKIAEKPEAFKTEKLRQELTDLYTEKFKDAEYANNIVPEILSKVKSAEELDGLNSIILDNFKKTKRPTTYVHAVLKNLAGKLKSPKEFKAASELIADYSEKLGDPNFYVNDVLPKLFEKTKSVEELKAWDTEVKSMIGHAKEKISGLDFRLDYEGTALPKVLEKVKSLEELKLVKELTAEYIDKLGNPKGYMDLNLPKMLEKAKTPEELKAWNKEVIKMIEPVSKMLGGDVASFYSRDVVSKVIDKVKSVEEFKAWNKEIKALLRETMIGEKMITDTAAEIDVLRTVLPNMLEGAESLQGFKVTKEAVMEYIKKFGNPKVYARMLPKIAEKAKTAEEFKAWDNEVKNLISYINENAKDPFAGANFLDVYVNALSKVVEKTKSFDELKASGKMIMDYLEANLGSNREFIESAVPNVLEKAKTPEELKAWSKGVGGMAKGISNMKQEVYKPGGEIVIGLIKKSKNIDDLVVTKTFLDMLPPGMESEKYFQMLNAVSGLKLKPKTVELMASQLSATEKAQMNTTKLSYFLLSLDKYKTTKSGESAKYMDIISSLPEKNQPKAMKKFIKDTAAEFQKEIKTIYDGKAKPSPEILLSTITDIEQAKKLAKGMGIETADPLQMVAALDEKVRNENSVLYGEPAQYTLKFSSKEIALEIPKEYEHQLSGMLGKALHSEIKAEDAIAGEKKFMDTMAALKEEGITEKNRDMLLEMGVPEGLLKSKKVQVDNIIQYLTKHKKSMSSENALALIKLGIEHSGKNELFGAFVNGTLKDKNLLYTILTEFPSHVEDALLTAYGEKGKIVFDLLKGSDEYKSIAEIRSKLMETEQKGAAAKKEYTLVFDKKTLPHLSLGKVAGTCFGDKIGILLPKDVFTVPILEKGEPVGNILFLNREIKGKKSLVMIGFDPSESVVAGLSNKKKFELTDMLMENIIDYVKKNDLDLYVSSEAGGLSNREGLENYLISNYFKGKKTGIAPITLHPVYNYTVKTAIPVIPEKLGMKVPAESAFGPKWKEIPAAEKMKHADEVFDIYKSSYGKKGLSYDNPAELLERLEFYLSLDKKGKANAFMAYSETKAGKRMGLIGALDSVEGKAAAIELLKDMGHKEGWYGMVSGAPAHIAIVNGEVPVVPFKTAQQLMGKPKGAKFSSAQQKMTKIKKMSGFSDSPVVLEAAERTGKKVEELAFSDLVEQAVLNKEIPDTPEAKENCYAIVQKLNGKDTVLMKIMIGKPNI